MKAILTLLLLFPLMLMAQVTAEVRGDSQVIVMSPAVAARIEFWGQKGISADPLIKALDTQVEILKMKIEFLEMINRNCVNAQEEYRRMVALNAEANHRLQSQLGDITRDRDKFKDRAKQRGLIIAAGSVALAGFVTLTLLQ